MATSNLYAVGPERVNHAPLSPLSVLKCAARIYPKCICVIRGGKQYTRKESDNRCIGKDQRNAVAVLRPIATVSDCPSACLPYSSRPPSTKKPARPSDAKERRRGGAGRQFRSYWLVCHCFNLQGGDMHRSINWTEQRWATLANL